MFSKFTKKLIGNYIFIQYNKNIINDLANWNV